MVLEKIAVLKELTIFSVLLRTVLAMVFSGILGYEREKKGRPAGFRTYMVVCIGSEIAMMTGIFLSPDNGGVNAREDVVEGLDQGFLGRSDVVPLERKKDGSFSARSSVLEETDFQAVSAFVEQKIRQAGRQILDGKIALDPYEQGNRNACEYCAYQKVCGFDKKIDGFVMRELENLKEDEAMELIRKEVADGNEVHGGSAAGH